MSPPLLPHLLPTKSLIQTREQTTEWTLEPGALVQILPITCLAVTLSRFPNLSVVQFPHLYNRHYGSTYIMVVT